MTTELWLDLRRPRRRHCKLILHVWILHPAMSEAITASSFSIHLRKALMCYRLAFLVCGVVQIQLNGRINERMTQFHFLAGALKY